MRFAFSSMSDARLARACADHSHAGPEILPEMPAEMQSVMEVVRFRLIPGITDPQFLALARGTKAALRVQPGFVSRSLLRSEDGLWTDLVSWRSQSEASAAAQAMMSDPAFTPFLAAINMGSVEMRHMPVLWQMGD